MPGDDERYTYQGSGTHHVHVKAYDNIAQSMTVDVNGTDYTWDIASGHLLSTTGVGTTEYQWTWTPTAFSFPPQGAAPVVLTGFDNLTPTMTVSVDGDTFTWNSNGYMERQNERWTKTSSFQFFPRHVDYWHAVNRFQAL